MKSEDHYARIAYKAYVMAIMNGEPDVMCSWEELEQEEKDSWQEAVEAVFVEYVRCK